LSDTIPRLLILLLPDCCPEYLSYSYLFIFQFFSYSPPLLYIKGNSQLLQEKSLAIVGSRNATETSLFFTDQIAMKAALENTVVVSGFAKGVDKQALDSAIKYNANSIIVLPQGIMTFISGYKTYYKQIVEGSVLLLSTFFPKAPWRVELAMARNPIIYGLAKDVFVAESSDKGGTWSGVIDGLRKNRTIYVRKPADDETNANELLIQKGAIPVSTEGIPVLSKSLSADYEYKDNTSETIKIDITSIQNRIIDLLKTGEFTAVQIKNILDLSWDEETISQFLKTYRAVSITNKRPLKFTISNNTNYQTTIFDIEQE